MNESSTIPFTFSNDTARSATARAGVLCLSDLIVLNGGIFPRSGNSVQDAMWLVSLASGGLRLYDVDSPYTSAPFELEELLD